MEITKVIERELTERRTMFVSLEDVEMLVDAMDGHYMRYMNRVGRTNQPRSKKESIELGKRQELFQRIARYRNEWEDIDAGLDRGAKSNPTD